ncbi:MAG: hypothetical protein ACR2FE_10635, partial [Aeromicrobium sp.]
MLAVIGAVVASRQPRNPIGWILGVISLSLGLLVLSAHGYYALALDVPEPSRNAVLVAWLASWIWIPAMIPTLTLFPLLFPTGRPLTSRWRPIVWMAIATMVVVFIGQAFAPGRFMEYPVDNPFGVDSVGMAIEIAGSILMAVTSLTSLASLVLRFRRSTGDERQQIKWVAVAAVLFIAIVVGTGPIQTYISEDVGFATLLVGILIIAIAVAVAMLKYRLYDIDIVINKAVVFVVLVGFITVVYAAIVVGLGRLLPFGEGNLVLAVVATAVVAVVFEPVRVRVQHWANRLVYGRRSTPYETLAAMTASIGDAADPSDALGEAARLLAEGTGAAQAVVWVARDGVLTPRATAGD